MHLLRVSQIHIHPLPEFDLHVTEADAEHIAMLRDRRKCSHFRILIIGEAGSGKTTLLEKACGVAEGIKPIIHDQCGK